MPGTLRSLPPIGGGASQTLRIEPAAGHRDHAVVEEGLRAEGQLHPPEPAPPAVVVQLAQHAEIRRRAAQGVIVAEGHVPDLGGEDRDDAGDLEAGVAVGKERDQGEVDAGKKSQHGNALQHVDGRQNVAAGTLVVKGPGGDDEGEEEREEVGDPAPGEGVERVFREGPDGDRSIGSGLRHRLTPVHGHVRRPPKISAPIARRTIASIQSAARRSGTGRVRVMGMPGVLPQTSGPAWASRLSGRRDDFTARFPGDI